MKRLLSMLVAVLLLSAPLYADRIHIRVGQKQKYEGAALAVGVIAVLHYHHGVIPRMAGKAVKASAVKIYRAMK